ncbi:MAG: exodeoxyribonuclease VII large subunit [Clostridia bacterium]|nr:exodeoxyribonuclease VII large subunit [Clostridia bacterium]
MRQSITVSELNAYVKDSLENNPMLKGIILVGEVSGFKKYPSGHSYFVLKDENASINAVLFAQYSSRSQNLSNGMLVEALGSVSLYSKEGRYQFIVRQIRPAGIGSLYIALEQLKKKLSDEGLFSSERKKSIPRFPKCVGIVTSGKGAAVRDIITVCKRRFPSSDLLVRTVMVQGTQAAPDIVQGIKEMNEYGRADVLIVGRGGGSQEDLWAFNTESVARAIAGSRIPVISAVGHETDTLLSDYVADLRAPTPSAAAELAVPDYKDIEKDIMTQVRRMSSLIQKRIQDSSAIVTVLRSALSGLSPKKRIDNERLQLHSLFLKMQNEVSSVVVSKEHRLEVVFERLKALNPSAVLSRGYTLLMNEDNSIIKTSKHELPETVKVLWSDGSRIISVGEQKREETEE